MIGMELLNLLRGDPLAGMVNPTPQPPNPSPMAPPPPQQGRPTPPIYPTDPKTGLVVGGPGSGLPPSYSRRASESGVGIRDKAYAGFLGLERWRCAADGHCPIFARAVLSW